MKTPREILLARQRPVEPKLDALRDHVVSGLHKRVASNPAPGFITSVRNLLHLPRLAWGGLATAWLIIITLNFAAQETTTNATLTAATKSSPETLQALREQKRLFAELIGGSMPRDAESPRPMPRPRSERKTPIAFA